MTWPPLDDARKALVAEHYEYVLAQASRHCRREAEEDPVATLYLHTLWVAASRWEESQGVPFRAFLNVYLLRARKEGARRQRAKGYRRAKDRGACPAILNGSRAHRQKPPEWMVREIEQRARSVEDRDAWQDLLSLARPEDRTLLEMIYVEGAEFARVAEMLDTSVRAVYERARRARIHIKRGLMRRRRP